jgi:hypothetical protein
MRGYYEIHITMQASIEGNPLDKRASRDHIKQQVEALKWKFSAIDGDPLLGDGVKVYATMHRKLTASYNKILVDLENTADALTAGGCEVIRKKIEIVKYDSIKGRDF